MKDHDEYLRKLRRQGYVIVKQTKSGHYRIYGPCGCLVSAHSQNGGSDNRGLANFKAEVRRHKCLRHGNGDNQAQEPGRRDPVGDRETGRDSRKEPQRAEHQRRDDQHPP